MIGFDDPWLLPSARSYLEEVSVQVILRSRRGNVALIDRKRYRVGDAIGADGWFVEEIDGVARSVLIVHRESGEKATLVVPLPRGR